MALFSQRGEARMSCDLEAVLYVTAGSVVALAVGLPFIMNKLFGKKKSPLCFDNEEQKRHSHE